MNISKLKVMKSAAGYYIGRTYQEPGIPHDLPYDRQSHYFGSPEEAAQYALDTIPEDQLDDSVEEVLEAGEEKVAAFA